jgi:oxygen-independent coproporphyrinogen-3 oxidase
LYVHVPFCAERCPFCSFATAPEEAGAHARYLRALRREIELIGALPWAPDVRVTTVFVGGGTPSLLSVEEMEGVLDTVHAWFDVDPGAEVTVECNPESVDRAKLEGYRAAGVTRVSLGVQSLDDAVLAGSGRRHTAGEAGAAFAAARAAGIRRVSVDLMYGLPGLDLPAWRRTVETVLDWGPDHLSAYGLTLDAGSVWGARGVAGLPEESAVIAQYWALTAAAGDQGFEHYEISNYARPGARSAHNQIYWRAEEYLAAGVGACGFVGDVRYGNPRALPRYWDAVEAGVLPIDTHERLGVRQRLAERLILGLRTADGVPRSLLETRTAEDRPLGRRIDDWREAGFLIDVGERTRLTEAGFLVSDTLFVELL